MENLYSILGMCVVYDTMTQGDISYGLRVSFVRIMLGIFSVHFASVLHVTNSLTRGIAADYVSMSVMIDFPFNKASDFLVLLFPIS